MGQKLKMSVVSFQYHGQAEDVEAFAGLWMGWVRLTGQVT